MKKIAVLGSSGGNLYTQGGNDPQGMMREIFNQADSAEIKVAFVQFVGTSGSMDVISKDAKARLYTLDEGGALCDIIPTMRQRSQSAAPMWMCLAPARQQAKTETESLPERSTASC